MSRCSWRTSSPRRDRALSCRAVRARRRAAPSTATVSASVGTATVDASGNWSIDIQAGGTANVANGDKVTFTLDGKAANESVTFQAGQFPAPPGIKLTAAPAGAAAPAPAKTGNAGLFGTTGTSMALVMVLGVFAATMVAGARTATRGR